MEMVKRERNSFVELLRIICIFGVLFMHKNGFLISEAKGVAVPWILIVNVFNFESSLLMFISAYYGNPYSSRKRLIKLWMMILFYSYFRLVRECIGNGFSFDFHDFSKVIRYLFPVTTGFSWFAAGYIIILSVAPYIEMMLEKMSRRQNLLLLIIIGAFFSFNPTFLTYYEMLSDSGKDVGVLLLFYLIGRYVKRYNLLEKHGIKYYLKILAVCIALVIILNYSIRLVAKVALGKSVLHLLFSRDLSVFEIIISLALLGISTKVNFTNKAINLIGKHSFGILLSENIVFIPTFISTIYSEKDFSIGFIGIMLLYVFVIMVQGFVLDMLRSVIFKGIENYVAEKASQYKNRLLEQIEE